MFYPISATANEIEALCEYAHIQFIRVKEILSPHNPAIRGTTLILQKEYSDLSPITLRDIKNNYNKSICVNIKRIVEDNNQIYMCRFFITKDIVYKLLDMNQYKDQSKIMDKEYRKSLANTVEQTTIKFMIDYRMCLDMLNIFDAMKNPLKNESHYIKCSAPEIPYKKAEQSQNIPEELIFKLTGISKDEIHKAKDIALIIKDGAKTYNQLVKHNYNYIKDGVYSAKFGTSYAKRTSISKIYTKDDGLELIVRFKKEEDYGDN